MNPQLNKFIKSIPHIATWDDLDYGLISGGTNWGLKDSVFYAFDMFWQMPSIKLIIILLGLWYISKILIQ